MKLTFVFVLIGCLIGCEHRGEISGQLPETPSVAQPLATHPSACDAAAAAAQSASDEVKEVARRVRRNCAQAPSARNCQTWIDRVPPAEATLISANREMIRQCTSADEIPGGAHCASVRTWPSAARALEAELLALVNAKRKTATNCNGTVVPPAPPLTMDGSLRCAARLHSADMAARGFLDHTNPDGLDFADRIRATGYTFTAGGETLAAGQTTARAVFDAWLASPGHCENLMSAQFSEIGVGLKEGTPHWTVDLALPRGEPAPPGIEPCEVTANWSSSAAQLEAQALQEINRRRAAGATCGGAVMPRVPAVRAASKLTCAARYHAQNMAFGGFFDHTTPWGETFFDRLNLVDYSHSFASEVLAGGFPTAAAAVDAWMSSPGHCEMIMHASAVELGVGFTASGNLWVAASGRPR